MVRGQDGTRAWEDASSAGKVDGAAQAPGEREQERSLRLPGMTSRKAAFIASKCANAAPAIVAINAPHLTATFLAVPSMEASTFSSLKPRSSLTTWSVMGKGSKVRAVIIQTMDCISWSSLKPRSSLTTWEGEGGGMARCTW